MVNLPIETLQSRPYSALWDAEVRTVLLVGIGGQGEGVRRFYEPRSGPNRTSTRGRRPWNTHVGRQIDAGPRRTRHNVGRMQLEDRDYINAVFSVYNYVNNYCSYVRKSYRVCICKGALHCKAIAKTETFHTIRQRAVNVVQVVRFLLCRI